MHPPAPPPFHALNLRWNPFGEPGREEAPGLYVGDVDEIAAHLDTPGSAVQLIGACGRGKTALLAALRARFPEVPYVYLAEGERVGALPTGGRLLIDEAQRLPSRRRARLFRRIGSLVLATHVDLSAELRRAGLTVVTRRVGGLDPDGLAAIVERRLAWAARGDARPPRPSRTELVAIIQRFGDDLRSILDHLYERYQDLADAVV